MAEAVRPAIEPKSSLNDGKEPQRQTHESHSESLPPTDGVIKQQPSVLESTLAPQVPGDNTMQTTNVAQEQIEQNQKLREKIRAHEGYATKVKSAYNELSEMYNQLRDDYAKFVTKHNDTTKALEDTRTKQSERINELESSMEEMERARQIAEEELRHELADSTNNLSAVKEDLEATSSINEELQRTVEEMEQLKEELDETRTHLKELEDDNCSQEVHLNAAKDELWSTLQDLKIFTRKDEGSSELNSGADQVEETHDDVNIHELVHQINSLRGVVREKVEELGGQKVEKEVKQLLVEENVDELVKELVKAKMDLAESETNRLQLHYELKTLQKQLPRS